MEKLKAELKRDCEKVATRAKFEVNYPATYYIQLINSMDIVEACEKLLNGPEIPDGYTNLLMMGRVDLTLEYMITNTPKYHALLSREAVQSAKDRCVFAK